MPQPGHEVVKASQVASRRWGIPASVQLAQWALESGWGKHLSGDFNYWGMKALPGQKCSIVATKEWYKGRFITVQAAFRCFDTDEESFDSHAKLLATGKPYAHARAALPNVFEFVRRLESTYATDPQYAEKLTSIIHTNRLQEYDHA